MMMILFNTMILQMKKENKMNKNQKSCMILQMKKENKMNKMIKTNKNLKIKKNKTNLKT